MKENDDVFWREVLATRSAAEALETEQMAAAEAELAEAPPAPPLAPDRVEAMVQAAQRRRLALPAVVPAAAPSRRRWQVLLRVVAAALLLVLVQPWLAAASSSVFEAFRELRLQRTADTLSFQQALRITADTRHAERTRMAAQTRVYEGVYWPIVSLRRIAAEPGPLGSCALRWVDQLRDAVDGPIEFGGKTLLGDARALASSVDDTRLSVHERTEAMDCLGHHLMQGLAVLKLVAAEPQSGRNAGLQRQSQAARRQLAQLLGPARG